MKQLIWAAVWLLLAFSQASGQTTLRLTLDDGSEIIGRCETPIKIQTAYGVISIDIESLDFITLGPRLTSQEQSEFKKHMTGLDGDDATTREKSQLALTNMSARAYPFVKREHKTTKSMEVKRRTEIILKVMEDKFLKNDLREPTPDRFVAVGLAGDGNVLGETVEINSDLLGKISVPLARIISVGITGRNKIIRLKADQEEWLDTGIEMSSGRWHLSVSGQIDMWAQTPGQYISDGTGLRDTVGKNSLHHAGTLAYTVCHHTPNYGYSGEALGLEKHVTGSGRLWLRIVQANWSNGAVSGELRISARLR